ncbi:hypothetical protein Cpin_3638 [Chitinophaga pinensis DSM 2588]|uniref:Uncharacterized protein n=1 Tax=Chitinophaga pinensis (strain ATCC 43595 / DSM 2588 / LMG 13176 / NBRC 15968 / NCIMB 11800 / UQM 2034) TaxID=485918 RepID=A0A979GXD2_CHIPD|nr:hypothetical protein Cpin_3638 [Chitinophaga pinensis DSM 2588]
MSKGMAHTHVPSLFYLPEILFYVLLIPHGLIFDEVAF